LDDEEEALTEEIEDYIKKFLIDTCGTAVDIMREKFTEFMCDEIGRYKVIRTLDKNGVEEKTETHFYNINSAIRFAVALYDGYAESIMIDVIDMKTNETITTWSKNNSLSFCQKMLKHLAE